MKPTQLITAIACALSLVSVASVARADWDIDMTLGTNVASPTSDAPSYIGPRFGLGLRYFVADNHAVGLMTRAHLLLGEDTQEELNWMVSYRFIGKPSESVHLLIGGSAGVGWWPECVHALETDACGGIGPALGAELGMQIPITEDVGITFGAEFVGRLATSDIKGMMMMPGGWAGVFF